MGVSDAFARVSNALTARDQLRQRQREFGMTFPLAQQEARYNIMSIEQRIAQSKAEEERRQEEFDARAGIRQLLSSLFSDDPGAAVAQATSIQEEASTAKRRALTSITDDIVQQATAGVPTLLDEFTRRDQKHLEAMVASQIEAGASVNDAKSVAAQAIMEALAGQAATPTLPSPASDIMFGLPPELLPPPRKGVAESSRRNLRLGPTGSPITGWEEFFGPTVLGAAESVGDFFSAGRGTSLDVSPLGLRRRRQ